MLFALGKGAHLSALIIGFFAVSAPQAEVPNIQKMTQHPQFESGVQWAQGIGKITLEKDGLKKDMKEGETQGEVKDEGKQEDQSEAQKEPCCQVSKVFKDQFSQKASKSSDASKTTEVLVFVSFSMPTVSFKNLAEEAAQGIIHKKDQSPTRLVMRGLVENSFKETAKKIKELTVGIDIDPKAFEEYGITRVPTFILVREGKEISRLSGNVSLSYAREKLQEAS